jgi:transposase
LEKQRVIDRQFEEIQRLKKKINVNQRTGLQGFFGSSTPSSQVPLKANSLAENQAKKGGGQNGHLGHGRQTFSFDEADERRIAEVSLDMCETCECNLHRISANERTIYEVERERVKKIYYQINRKVCPKCRKMLSGKVENAFAGSSLSNELIVEIAEQHYVLGRTLGQISERFGLNDATVLSNLKLVGSYVKPCLEKLKTDYRQAEIRHADETSWRTDGGNGWSWYFGSKDVSLHLFRATRSASVVREVLGTQQLTGVLIVDRYAGYNRVPCEIQYCYAHLLREISDLEQEFETNQEVKTYTNELKTCLTDAMQLRNRKLNNEDYKAEAEKIKGKIIDLSKRKVDNFGVRKWQNFFVEKESRLFGWIKTGKIQAENNYAEREIRKVVIARKMSFGSQSEEGAKTREIWTSILQTLKKREENPRDKLVKALNKLSQNKDLDIAEELFGSPTP